MSHDSGFATQPPANGGRRFGGGMAERRWGRMATGPRMIVILAAALLPLGLLAILASIQSGAGRSDWLLILLPILIWLVVVAIVWITVQRQLVRPLAIISRRISAWQPGDSTVTPLRLRTPAREIGELDAAFSELQAGFGRRERELEAAVERQANLIREIHHRVKNNLQVVASLLSLHARGVAHPEAAAAYASIQRRVDALALVHRHHLAETDEKAGVALKPVISELAANLRASAPTPGIEVQLDIAPLTAGQDAAVPIAFLITEISEQAMLTKARSLSILLEPASAGRARLCLKVSGGEAAEVDTAPNERFERIVTGLARQLRSPLERDAETGLYAIEVPIFAPAA